MTLLLLLAESLTVLDPFPGYNLGKPETHQPFTLMFSCQFASASERLWDSNLQPFCHETAVLRIYLKCSQR